MVRPNFNRTASTCLALSLLVTPATLFAATSVTTSSSRWKGDTRVAVPVTIISPEKYDRRGRRIAAKKKNGNTAVTAATTPKDNPPTGTNVAAAAIGLGTPATSSAKNGDNVTAKTVKAANNAPDDAPLAKAAVGGALLGGTTAALVNDDNDINKSADKSTDTSTTTSSVNTNDDKSNAGKALVAGAATGAAIGALANNDDKQAGATATEVATKTNPAIVLDSATTRASKKPDIKPAVPFTSISYQIVESWGNTGKGMDITQHTLLTVDQHGNWNIKTTKTSLKTSETSVRNLDSVMTYRDLQKLQNTFKKSTFMKEKRIASSAGTYSTSEATLTITTATGSNSVSWQGHAVASTNEVTPDIYRLPATKVLFYLLDSKIPRG